MRPRLLDLFCGAGGCTKGYQRAGFHVTGVDLHPQPNYCGDAFIPADALEYLARPGWCWGSFDAIHASPPCQFYSSLRSLHPDVEYVDLISPTRELLIATGLPYVIENVELARSEMVDPVTICGSSLGLDLRRHRLFETNWPLMVPPCAHGWQTRRFRSLDQRLKGLARVVGVHGHLNYPGERELREKAMEIDWMTVAELAQAIPPAYTELIGHQLMAHVQVAA